MRDRFAVTEPNLDYWKSQINCQAACPVHTDARGYVRAIADGDYERAYFIARGPNPLASICGRICGAPCETACRRGQLDAPVAIRALKRFVMERHSPSTATSSSTGMIEFLKTAARRYGRDCQSTEELLPLMQALLSGDIPKVEGLSIGIIGSGPAGLAAAHDLALLGFSVTVYESESTLAGMLALGVPEYRLPRDLIRAEVDVILGLGVKAVTNCAVGRDVSLAELRQRHDAVIIAVGLKKSRQISIPGVDAEGVLGGVEFLREVAMGTPPHLGGRVVVIGGGNVAYDVGRTVLRQVAMDAARTAMRDAEVGHVYLCSLESLDEMPADLVEIEEGDEEGIQRRNGWGPVEIVKNEAGRVRGVVFRRCLSVYDANRRFAPTFDDSAREFIECDSVLLSVGQVASLDFLGSDDQLERTSNNAINCDPTTGTTSAPDIFIAGDLAYGAKLLIHAVASGKQVARSVYEALTGNAIGFRDVELHFPIHEYAREQGYETTRRVATKTTPVQERLKSQSISVELGLNEEEAQREASRCLDCGINTIFDQERCVACGGCVDVCPHACLSIVSLTSLTAADGAHAVLDRCDDPDTELLAIIKDETICIRCGMCADRCPVGAISMKRFQFAATPVLRTAGACSQR